MKKTVFVFWMSIAQSAASTTGTGLTYLGRLIDPGGNPVESSTVQFKIQIRSPLPTDCLMYEEQRILNMSGSGGAFGLGINDGGGSRTDGGSYTLHQVFGNVGSMTFTPATCGGGNVYTPGNADGRRIVVSFNDGTFSGWESLPEQAINYVPSSIESFQVGGFPSSSLLRVADVTGTPQTASPLSVANFNDLVALINGTSAKYIPSSSSGASLPVFTGTPAGVSAGDLWFDSSNAQLKFYDGSAVRSVSVSSGTVTSVAAGTGLTGGPITSSGTLSLAPIGSGGSGATKITYDTYGRVTSSATLTGSDITSGTIGGSTAISTSGNLQTLGDVSSKRLVLYEHGGSGPNFIAVQTPNSVGTSYSLIFPANQGAANQTLINDGLGNLSWSALSAGSVTSVTGTAPISVATGTTTPAISIPKATASVDGYLAAADFAAFSSKQSAGNYVTALTGDVTSSAFSGGTVTATIAKIQTTPLTVTSLTSGNYLKYNGTDWVNATPSSADLSDAGSLLKSSQMPANCNAGQTLTFSSPTSTWSCSNIAVTASNFGTQTANTFLAAPNGSDGAPTFRTLGAADLPSGTLTGAGTASYLPRYTAGNTLGNSLIYDSGTNIGIGTATGANFVDFRLDQNSSSIVQLKNGSTGTSAMAGYYLSNNLDTLRLTLTGSGNGGSSSLTTTAPGGLTFNVSNASGDLAFKVNGGDRLHILSAGNVGIGSTNPAYKLDVVGDINSSTGIRIGGTSVCTSSGCTSSSDGRLKKNIRPLEEGLPNILKIEAVTYDWIDSAKYGAGKQIGVIAQELEEVYPELVVTDPSTGLKSVAYDHLVAPVIEAVKSIFERVVANEGRLESLRKADESFERRLRDLERANEALRSEIKAAALKCSTNDTSVGDGSL